MITISYSDIPGYLHGGSFYRALNAEEQEGEIQVPEECYCLNNSVSASEDLAKLLRITAFWGLDRLPETVVVYCDEDAVDWYSMIQEDHPEWQFAQDLLEVFCSPAGEEENEDDNKITRAIRVGRTEIVEYLVFKYECSVFSSQVAAEMGRLDYLQLLRRFDHPWDESVCASAAKGGNMACLQYLHVHGCRWDEEVYYSAAKYNHFDCMKYAYEQGLVMSTKTPYFIADAGNLTMLEYAVAHGCPFHAQVADIAAYRGHVDCLRYLLEAGCAIPGREARQQVCRQGYLECMQVMTQYGMVWTEWDSREVARYGQLECLQYLHERGCPWDEEVPLGAAEGGHLNTLRYAIENGCPIEDPPYYYLEAVVETVSGECLQCLQYLLEERRLPMKQDTSLFIAAFTYGNYRAMQYMIDRKTPFKCIDRNVRMRWYSDLRAHFEILQENEDDNSSEEHTSPAQYDANLVKCIQCVVGYNWRMDTYGGGLGRFVEENAITLPLCYAFLKPWLEDGLGSKKRKWA